MPKLNFVTVVMSKATIDYSLNMYLRSNKYFITFQQFGINTIQSFLNENNSVLLLGFPKIRNTSATWSLSASIVLVSSRN